MELQSNPGDQPSILVLSLPCTKVSLFLRGKICSSSSFRQKWTGSSVSDCLFNRETGQFGKKQAVIMVGTLKTDLLDEWRAVFCFVFAFCQLCFGHRPSGIMSIKHNLFKSANIYWLTSMYKEIKKCADSWERWVIQYSRSSCHPLHEDFTRAPVMKESAPICSSLAFLIDLHLILSKALLFPGLSGTQVQDCLLVLF